jgi:hypothetical protein
LRFENWGHDLLKLAEKGRFALDRQEMDFIRISANPSIVTFGRYPLPRSKSEPAGAYSLHSSWIRLFESIFDRALNTALDEWMIGAPPHVIAEANGIRREIATDVPNWMRCG